MSADAWRAELQRHDFPAEKIARLVDGIRYGVLIGYTGDRSRGRTAKNAGTTEDERVAGLISAAIAADVVAGHKRGPFSSPPFTPFHVSPLNGVPKGENGESIRVIHNLSHPFGGDSINANISREEYVMQRFEDALAGVRRLGRGCWLSKFDVRAAFKLVPVRPGDRPLLGLCWQGQYYYEVVLPFGLRTSGYRWEEYAVALHYLCKHEVGIELVFHYVDDFLFVAPPGARTLAVQQRRSFERLCRRLGVPIADEKTVGPATLCVFLGVEIDTAAMECRLTEKRIGKLRTLLQAWVNSDDERNEVRVSCEELASVVGKLEFATVVIRAGTAFLKRLRGMMMSMKDDRGYDRSRRLDQEARLDVRWWLDAFLTAAGNRRDIYEPEWVLDKDMEIFTDACNTGYGARFGNHWFQGRWSEEQLEFAKVNVNISMPYLELHALVHAAATWGHLWRGKKITFRCDAEAAVRAVEAMRSRKNSLSALLRLLYSLAVRNDFLFQCKHVAGKANVVADALSRNCTLQELHALLPTADAKPTPAPQLPVDGEPMVAWEEDAPPPVASPPQRQ